MSKYLSLLSIEGSMSAWHYLVIFTTAWLVYQYLKPVTKVHGLPIINRAERFDFFSIKMKQNFLNHASELMRKGFEQVSCFGTPRRHLKSNFSGLEVTARIYDHVRQWAKIGLVSGLCRGN